MVRQSSMGSVDDVPHLDVWNTKFNSTRPRKLLSLDGGGILGVISLEILLEIESHLAEKTLEQGNFRLGNYFDYIAGTSTGSIIATGLALGMRVSELIEFYEESGEIMFTKANIIKRWRSKYLHSNLERTLKAVVGTRTLGATDLKCLLMVMTKNATTNSPWPLTNCHLEKYNKKSHPFCNLDIPLWKIIRASTAAPTFFSPEKINLNNAGSKEPFYFVDGGVTPYNNPSLALFRRATMPEYGLSWQTGINEMLLVSIGTGSHPRGDTQIRSRGRTLVNNGIKIPMEMMANMSQDQDLNCRLLGKCFFGPVLNRELGNLEDTYLNQRIDEVDSVALKMFSYARFDPDVSQSALNNMGVKHIKEDEMLSMDKPQHIKKMRKVGRTYATEIMKMNVFDEFI